MSLAYTKAITATSTPVMILGRDGNRLELTIFNTSETDYLHLGFGSETSIFSTLNTLPLAPGEAYDATTPPLNAIYLLTRGPDIPCIVYYSSKSPAYVTGLLGGSGG